MLHTEFEGVSDKFRESAMDKYLAQGERRFVILVGDLKSQKDLAEHYVRAQLDGHTDVQYEIREKPEDVPTGKSLDDGLVYIRYAYGGKIAKK